MLEPSAGSGRFVEHMRAAAPDATLHAVEIDDSLAEHLGSCGANSVVCGSFLTYAAEPYDFVCGNPPYGVIRRDESGEPVLNRKGNPIVDPVAEDHVRHALSLLAPGGSLIFVLRAGFFEAKKHYELVEAEHRPRHILKLNPRPRFFGRGDSTPYFAVLWTRGWEGTTTTETYRW